MNKDLGILIGVFCMIVGVLCVIFGGYSLYQGSIDAGIFLQVSGLLNLGASYYLLN